MPVCLYKKGSTHVVRGVECEMVICSVKQMAGFLSSGCVVDPSELCGSSFNDVDANNSGKLSTEEIREAAKKAGIGDWDKKRIKTLKKELGL